MKEYVPTRERYAVGHQHWQRGLNATRAQQVHRAVAGLAAGQRMGREVARVGAQRKERPFGQQVVFGFDGSDDAQAGLMEGIVRLGIRMRAFEEKRSSFEDILVGVAESNRRA